ncbi:MAG: class I SAM-dependent methyltransferase [Candidatus Paceibacterota bacterium]
MVLETNIDWWQKIVESPTSEFQKLFDAEREFLLTNIPSESYVLDVGCGDGRGIETIIKQTQKIIGVDNDLVAVNEINNRFRHSPNVYAELCTAQNLTFGSNTFDLVTHLMLLPNLGDRKEFSIGEAARVLKSGGKLLLSTYAETALEIRIAMSESIDAPILDVDGESGTIIYSLSSGNVTSEQFSLEQLKELGEKAGLTMVNHQKVGELAYLVVFEK